MRKKDNLRKISEKALMEMVCANNGSKPGLPGDHISRHMQRCRMDGLLFAAGALTAAALAAGSIAGCGSSAQETGGGAAVQDTEKKEEDVEALLAALASDRAVSEEQRGKEETVYLFADSEGGVTSSIVSGWLKNPDGAQMLTDRTELGDIVNVKGDETFQKEGDIYTWQADGHDIYYQGTTQRAAPVTEKITYYLNGEKIAAKDLAGKSGHVRIRFDYENTQKAKAVVNGKEEEIHVPFAVVTGAVLNDHFKNITVENGRLVSDGKNNIVVGFALPGLKESLKLDEEKEKDLNLSKDIKMPDYVEISADAVDFALDMTLTVAVSSSDLSFDEALDFSDLDEKIDTLSDSSTQLRDGTTELSDGIATLKDSMGEFSDGAASLKDGILDYTDGTATLSDGITQVQDGVVSLDDGAGTLLQGIDSLNGGVGDLKKGIESAKDGAAQLAEGINKKDGAKAGAKQLSEGAAALKAGFEGDQGAVVGAKQVADGVAVMGNTVKSTMSQAAAMKQALLASEVDVVRQVYRAVGKADVADAIHASNVGTYAKGLEEIRRSVEEQITGAVAGIVRQTAEKEAKAAAEKAYQAGIEKGMEEAQNAGGGRSVSVETASEPETEEISEETGKSEETDSSSEQEGGRSEESENEQKETQEEPKDEQQEERTEEKAAAEPEEESRDNNTAEASAGAEFAETSLHRVEERQKERPVSLTFDSRETYETMLLDEVQETEDKQPEVSDALSTGLESLVMIGQAQGAVQAIEKILGQLENSGASMTTEEMKEMEAQVEKLVLGASALSDGINRLYAGTVQLFGGASELNEGMEKLGKGADTLSDGMDQLGKGGSDLKEGTEKLRNGGSELKDGTQKLKSGAAELADGAKELTDHSGELLDGAGKLFDGTAEITDGVEELHDGAGELLDGMIRFDEDGIEKIAGAYNHDVKSLSDRVKAVSDAGRSYDNFCGKMENMKSSVKFILKTEAVK